MFNLLIQNVKVILSDTVLDGMSVGVIDEKIVSVFSSSAGDGKSADEVFDGGGGYLSSGFIDLHIHGVRSLQFDKGPDDLQAICKILPSYGVTGVLAGVLPLPPGEDNFFIKSLSEREYEGAQLLGFFFEGPFLGLPGAINPKSLIERTEERVRAMRQSALPYRSIFAVSPEVENASGIISAMKDGGNPVFITHTAADVEQTLSAIDAGVSHATHFYDVFPCPVEQDPGVRPCGAVEAVLASPDVSVDFIFDSEHVDPVAVKMALACKGPEKVCLVTDASLGAGNPPGIYKGIGDMEVSFAYEGAPARGTVNSPCPGGLAGSGLTMDRAVRNAVKLLEISIPQACRMASLNPAAVLGLDNELGKIEEGYSANMVLLDDNLEVKATWVKGKREY
ncbi:MAG: hypothetical protein DRP49_04940 [Spirochaetes bacterium]|nr:MAG: hypothetical protein DRP49_04940 [Spirochaetota bacterium]